MRIKLDFEDVDLEDGRLQDLYTYHNLSWTGIAAFDPSATDVPIDRRGVKGVGYLNGVVSGEQIAFAYNYPAQFSVAGGSFDSKSAYVTSAFRTHGVITVTGYLGDEIVHQTTVEITRKMPTLINFDFEGVDRVDIAPEKRTQVVFDDILLTHVRLPAETPLSPRAFGHDCAATAIGSISVAGHDSAHEHGGLWSPATLHLA